MLKLLSRWLATSALVSHCSFVGILERHLCAGQFDILLPAAEFSSVGLVTFKCSGWFTARNAEGCLVYSGATRLGKQAAQYLKPQLRLRARMRFVQIMAGYIN